MHKLAVLKSNEKQKQNVYTKGRLFPSPPSRPPESFCIFPPLGKLDYNSRRYLFFYKCCLSEQKADVTFLQQISKRRHYFPEERVLFRSNLDSGLKRKWYVYSLFGFLQKRGGVWGLKKKSVFTKTSPNYTIFSASFNKAKGVLQRKGVQTPGRQVRCH